MSVTADTPSQRQPVTLRELLLVGQMWFVVRLVSISVKLRGFQKTHTLLGRFMPGNPIAMRHTPRRLGSIVNKAAVTGPAEATCLQRSLTLWWLLKRRGIESTIHIGVSKDEGSFTSHAWVEHEHEIINDTPEHCNRFKIITSAS